LVLKTRARKKIRHCLGVVGKIGAEIETSSGVQAEKEKIQKITVYKAPLPMTFFGPGVWAVDVDGIQTFRADVTADQVACFHAKDTNIADAGTMGFTAGFGASLVVNIDSEEIHFRLHLGQLQYEVTGTAANFKSHRGFTVENSSEVFRAAEFLFPDEQGGVDLNYSLGHGKNIIQERIFFIAIRCPVRPKTTSQRTELIDSSPGIRSEPQFPFLGGASRKAYSGRSFWTFLPEEVGGSAFWFGVCRFLPKTGHNFPPHYQVDDRPCSPGN
jgi:hypothetical protein